MDKLIMDTQRLKEVLSTTILRKLSYANGKKRPKREDCVKYENIV